MNKLLSVLLSLSLIWGSVTPSLAQSWGKGLRNGLKAGQSIRVQGRSLLRGAAASGRAFAPEASSLKLMRQVESLAAAQRPIKFIPGVRLPKGMTVAKVDALFARLLPAEPSFERSLFVLNTLPSLNIYNAYSLTESQLGTALADYHATLMAYKYSGSGDLQIWGQTMAAVSNIGIYGSAALDAYQLIGLYRRIPAELRPYSEVVIGRALLTMNATRQLEQLALLSAGDNGLTGDWWKECAAYLEKHHLDVKLPAFAETQPAAVSMPEDVQKALKEWSALNERHTDVSVKATEEWVELASQRGAVVPDPVEAAETTVPGIQNTLNVQPAEAANLSLAARDIEGGAHLETSAAGGGAKPPVPPATDIASPAEELPQSFSGANEAVSASSAAPQRTSLLKRASAFLSRKYAQFKNGLTVSTPMAELVPVSLTVNSAVNREELSSALVTAHPGVKTKKIVKEVERALSQARTTADVKFVALAKEAEAQGRYLTEADYNQLLSDEFSAAVAARPVLTPYAKTISEALSSPAVAASGSKRELSFSLKIHDKNGVALPVTFDLELRLMDATAVKQLEKLDIASSEVFSLGYNENSKTFELLLSTPGGTKRPVYEPFFVGGKAGIEALYYRLLGNYKNGLTSTNNKVTLSLYSDVHAERATMWAGLTEGLGGLPQAVVAVMSTILKISDPKALQQGVSHSQLGNVASVVFSGLQKVLGIKNTLALGLGVSALGLLSCGLALSLPTMLAKVAGLATGSFILGVGANGGVKSTNSIFAKEMSNDNTSGTARMGLVNARASVGTMTGYLFFPISVLAALSGLEAFQVLYYGATVVPAYALLQLLRSRVQVSGSELSTGAVSLSDKMKVLGGGLLGVGENIFKNIKFAISGGYQERLTALREKGIFRSRKMETSSLINKGKPAGIFQRGFGAIRNLVSEKTLPVRAAASQYMLRMMALVGLYHFAGMMFNSGPGAIIGNFIKSPEGASIVNWVQNMPSWLTAVLAGGAGIAVGKMGQSLYKSFFKKSPIRDVRVTEETTSVAGKTKSWLQKNLSYVLGGLTAGATLAVPEVGSVAHTIFSRVDAPAVAQLATFFTAYIGVWAGRKYLSGFVKKGKLSPQGIIGASGVLSTVAVSLAFIPGLPLAVRAALWGVAGLGFANLAGFENSLAMEKYPKNKPAVNMAYTLARLSGTATVLYGSLANSFKDVGIADPEVYALVLPAGALILATLMNGKYFTRNFVADVKKWRNMKPTLSYKAVRTSADDYYNKFLRGEVAAEDRAFNVRIVARQLAEDTRHELSTIENLMLPMRNKLRINEVRLKVIDELKALLNGAEHNNVAAGTEVLDYKKLKNREVLPLLKSMSGKVLTPEREAEVIRTWAGFINQRYSIQAADLEEMGKGILNRNEGLDEFRLDILREMYKMELEKVALDRAERYQGNRPSFDRSMQELSDMADKVLGAGHGWVPPQYRP